MYRDSDLHREQPSWWQRTRSIYCPAAGGAGSALMSFALSVKDNDLAGALLDDSMGSWADLDRIYSEAEAAGSSVLYLADFWEGGYHHKGDYHIREDFGGPAAFTRAVQSVHARGGKVIVYLEAFIIARNSDVGLAHGTEWAMTNFGGSYQDYWGIHHGFYQMWPGKGSGWNDYIASVAERLIRDHDVDGIHLDSYGCQFGWFSHNPAHPDGLTPGAFDAGAVDLVIEVRDRVRAIKPEAVVMMEGSDGRNLLAACDGGQDWSLGWYQTKEWVRSEPAKIFTSEYSLPRMTRILALGLNVSIARWWNQGWPDEALVNRVKAFEPPPSAAHRKWTRESWLTQFEIREPVRDLFWCFNAVYANGLAQPGQIDIDWLREKTPPFPAPPDPYMGTDEAKKRWGATTHTVLELLEKLDPETARTPGAYLRETIERATAGLIAL